MIKFVVLLSAALALAAAGPIKVTPATLHKVFAFIDGEVTKRQGEAHLEIQATLAPLRSLGKEVRERITSEMEAASTEYKKKVRDLEKEAKEDHEDISACIDIGVSEIEKLYGTVLTAHRNKVERLEEEAVKIVNRSLTVSEHALAGLKELRQRVEQCTITECANALEIIIVEFYDTTIIELDTAVIDANRAALIRLPIELNKDRINTAKFIESTEVIYKEVAACANLNVAH